MPSQKKPSGSVLAYSYIRFSSPEQARGDSLRRQTELRNAWLEKSGVFLDTGLTLRDEGVSAYSGTTGRTPTAMPWPPSCNWSGRSGSPGALISSSSRSTG